MRFIPTWLIEMGVMATVTAGLLTVASGCPVRQPSVWQQLAPMPAVVSR